MQQADYYSQKALDLAQPPFFTIEGAEVQAALLAVAARINAEHSDVNIALSYFLKAKEKLMQARENKRPSGYVLPCMIRACISLQLLKDAESFLSDLDREIFENGKNINGPQQYNYVYTLKDWRIQVAMELAETCLNGRKCSIGKN